MIWVYLEYTDLVCDTNIWPKKPRQDQDSFQLPFEVNQSQYDSKHPLKLTLNSVTYYCNTIINCLTLRCQGSSPENKLCVHEEKQDDKQLRMPVTGSISTLRVETQWGFLDLWSGSHRACWLVILSASSAASSILSTMSSAGLSTDKKNTPKSYIYIYCFFSELLNALISTFNRQAPIR